MSITTSNNVKNIEISGIRKFFNKVVNYPEAVSLTLGQPDFPMPESIKTAVIKAVGENKTIYTANAGLLELRQEISKYLTTQKINYSAEEICVTVGGSEAITSVFSAILNPGDVVLVPTPAYPAYESCVKMLGATVENYSLNNEFNLDIKSIEAKIVELKPKAIVISFPTNPTGAVLSKESAEELSRIIAENDIITISDEIYSALVFEDCYNSIAQYSDIKEKVVLVSGFSKMFSMTGLRIGYVCAAKTLMDEIMKVHQYTVSCAPSIGQYGALEGLKYAMEDVKAMKTSFIKRRDMVYNELIKLGFEVVKPKGAFYIFPSIKKYGMSSDEFCERLLKEAGVAIVPGSAFGSGGEGYVRISYCYSEEQLQSALNQIKEWLNKL